LTDASSLQSELLAQIAAAGDEAALEAVRVAALGKKGAISELMKPLGGMSPEEKKIQGPLLNGLRDTVTEAIAARKSSLGDAALEQRLASETIDVTLPPRPENAGTVHPISQVLEEVTAIFAGLGFAVAEGPDVEYDDYNFTKLNIPPDHPARQMQDTFYVSPQADGTSHVLRTHTSPVQVRTMLNAKPPIRIISPGRTYRVDSDATHSPMFHQVEGLWIAEDISFADLKGVYTDFLRRFFESDDLVVRFRPSFFPFTEPSAEIDMMFTSGPNRGRWLEISGSGQVHPQVVRNFGLDPERYIGFAFGSGLERLTMLRYGVNDLRQFYEGDLRFLRQFNE
jgi:phenylalanyl-tRNA synthetase alpha chain